MRYDAEFILKWNDRLLSTRRLFEWAWRDINDYILVNKTGIDELSAGQKKTTKLFDSTATRALKRLAATMHGSLTSSSMTWFKLRMRDEPLNRIKRVRLWLEDTGDIMLQELNHSNFASEVQEIYTDLIGPATAAMFSEEREMTTPGKFPGIRFQAIPVGTFVIDEGPDGIVDCLFRTIKLTPHSIVRRFVGTTLPDKILDEAKQRKDTLHEIVHAICPREIGKTNGLPDTRYLPYSSTYVLRNPRAILRDSGFHEFPCQVPRWDKLSGETYGRGPSHEILPDVKTLNKAVELSLKAFGKAIDPPLKAKNDGIVGGEVRLQAGGITYVTDMESLVPMELGSKWDVIKFKVEDLRQAIKEAYLADHIQLKESPAMTAEEVRTRHEQMIRLLGPTLGRLESEFLNPLIQRVFNMMYRGGAIPMPPEEVFSAMANNRGDIDIEYVGPLSRGQRINEVYAMERMVAFIQPVSAVNPGVLDNYDFDEMARISAQILGAPESVIRDEKDVEDIRKDRAEAEAEDKEISRGSVDAKTAKDLKDATPETANQESEEAQVLRLIQGGRA